MNQNGRFQQIFISKSSLLDPVTEEILSRYPRRIQRIVPDNYDISADIQGTNPKNILYLTRSKGDVVKGCPGTAESYLCCNYQVINQTLNCPLNCVYCILQFYLNQPATVLYTNFDEIFDELTQKIALQPERFFRIGTGELGDSMALPGSRLFARAAVGIFAKIPNAILELKSKTVNIDDLLGTAHNGRTVLAWSINPQDIITHEELNTASLMNRLNAAKRAAEAGFMLAFHLDPILHYPDWEGLYSRLIDELYLHIMPENIAWISMGSLRFPPSMKEKMIERYPSSILPFGEMIRGMDGKLRYARPVRIPMYQLIYNKLIQSANLPFIYFCMESKEVWESVMGFSPDSNAHLDYLFAESLHRRFPGLISKTPTREAYEKGHHLDQMLSIA